MTDPAQSVPDCLGAGRGTQVAVSGDMVFRRAIMMSMTWWMWLLLLLGGWAILLLVHFLGGKIIERLASPEHFLPLFSERIRWPWRLFCLAVVLRICIPLAPTSSKWQSYLIVGDMLVLIVCTTWRLMSAVESLFQLVVVRHPLNVSDNLR